MKYFLIFFSLIAVANAQIIKKTVKTTAYALTCYQGKSGALIQALQESSEKAASECISLGGNRGIVQNIDEKIQIDLNAQEIEACSGVRVRYQVDCIIIP